MNSSEIFWFGSYTRLSTNKMPSYKCGENTTNGLFEATQAVEDKFSASTTGGGNGQLKYPIALMTADEISFAGGVDKTGLSSPYAWYYTNSMNSAIVNIYATSWNLLLPYGGNNTAAGVFLICGPATPPGGFNICNITVKSDSESIANVVRPVISISECAKVKSGNGTPESPYEIDYDSSCN